MLRLLLTLSVVYVAFGTVYFKDSFEGDWEKRWIVSTKTDKPLGKWILSAGEFYGSADEKGLKTSEDSKHYEICAEIPEDFSNKGKKLVIQYTMKHEQGLDCGGGYIKFLPKNSIKKCEDFTPDSEYNIMFGPDICGATKKTHVILTKNDDNILINKNVKVETDKLTHIYTLILSPDNTFEVKIDGKTVESGKIDEAFDILLPKKIQDPKVSKPNDWVDLKEIDDPSDIKPQVWDDIPATIPDSEAVRPADWNDEDDGAWEAPTIDNPEYNGPWKARKIPNPEYKGEWEHPLIDNPEYKYDPELYSFESFKYVGIDIWQVKSGSIFDNILITDDVDEAKEEERKILKLSEKEKKLFDEAEKLLEEKKAEEADAAKNADVNKGGEEDFKPDM